MSTTNANGVSSSASGLVVTVCGGGNAIHALAGILPNAPGVAEVNILSTFGDEAERFLAEAAKQNGEVKVHFRGEETRVVRGRPTRVTSDPSVVASSDVVMMAVPAFAHGGYLSAVAPHIRTDGSARGPGGRVVLGAMPGEGGFDMQALSILGKAKLDCISLFTLETLPWAVRLTEFGRSVEILGTKKDVEMAVSPANHAGPIRDLVQSLVGDHEGLPLLELIPSMLAVTLMNINSVWHPVITWGRYRDWDFVTPFDSPPLFYEGVDDATAEMLSSVSNEVLAVKNYLEAERGLDLSGVMHVKDWMEKAYSDDIANRTTLRSMINTNKGYAGLTHPMKKTPDGKYLPDFGFRYMREDVPLGLAVTKGLAELCRVDVPNMTAVIKFACKATGRRYLGEDGMVAGAPDLQLTRCPQAFGINTLDELIHKLNY